MKELIKRNFEGSIRVKQDTLKDNADAIAAAAAAIIGSLQKGGKVLIFGNGGSAADSQHMAAELSGRFQKDRKALAAVALTTDTSALTALGNDYGFEAVFARQVEALGKKGDVAVGISTSGNSANVLKASETAKAMGLTTISLTGNGGGKLAGQTDIKLVVPSKVTARIQESHICIIHCICEIVENAFSS